MGLKNIFKKNKKKCSKSSTVGSRHNMTPSPLSPEVFYASRGPSTTGGYGSPGASSRGATGGYGSPGASSSGTTGGYGSPGASSRGTTGGYGSPGGSSRGATGGYGSPGASSRGTTGGYGSPGGSSRGTTGGYGSPLASSSGATGGYGSPLASSSGATGGYGSPLASSRGATGGYGSPLASPKKKSSEIFGCSDVPIIYSDNPYSNGRQSPGLPMDTNSRNSYPDPDYPGAESTVMSVNSCSENGGHTKGSFYDDTTIYPVPLNNKGRRAGYSPSSPPPTVIMKSRGSSPSPSPSQRQDRSPSPSQRQDRSPSPSQRQDRSPSPSSSQPTKPSSPSVSPLQTHIPASSFFSGNGNNNESTRKRVSRHGVKLPVTSNGIIEARKNLKARRSDSSSSNGSSNGSLYDTRF